MSRARRALGALGGVALLVTAFVAVAAPASARVPAEDEIVTVQIHDNSFTPPALVIRKGTTVRWVNDGRNTHNVTPDTGDAFGTAGNLKPGQTYVHTFDAPGTFAYYCTLHGAPGQGQHAAVGVDTATVAPVPPIGEGEQQAPAIAASGRSIRVPRDARTIQAAVDRARPGDLVLVAPGVYHEAVRVSTDGVVIRGEDRNTTVLDGQFRRANGVFVIGADGVAVENLTARNYTENGFFWNGALGYRGSYLTAYRNGDYGLYTYDSQYGQFDHSYASGSPDSGFYIGQCNPCHAVITDVVSEYNQLGYSGTNSSGDLFLVSSVWRHNRTGIVPNSLDSEELAPQGQATIAGNEVSDNGSAIAARTDTTVFDAVFGGGIVVIGGVSDVITRNHVVDNTKIGIALAPNPFLEQNFYAALGNTVTDNVVSGSGLVDMAVIPFSAADGNCFSGNTAASTAPTALDQLAPCGGAIGSGDPAAGALDVNEFLDTSQNPPGRDYRRTPVPGQQRNLPNAPTARARPAGAPAVVDLEKISTPTG